MSIYYGDDAISHLAGKQHEKDEKSSSFWDEHHSSFNFKEVRFEGLSMLGSEARTFTNVQAAWHHIFQTPFRIMARNFLDFKTVNVAAKNILSKQDKGYSMDVLRQVITLSYLNSKGVVKDKGTSCVIGDGYATMTSLLLEHNRQRVILVNLSKTLLVDIHYLKLLLKNNFNTDVMLVSNKNDMEAALLKENNKPSVIVVEAVNHQLIQLCPIDLTINIASMQEMNPEVVEEYFADISIAAKQHSSIFYCCNREEKILNDGEILKFRDYPWHLASQILDDEICPWHQKYYSTKPPFYHNFDGDHYHRLVKFE